MLAKEIKIKNILVQRKFIISQLTARSEKPSMDGDTLYSYTGYIYPENIEYLRREGFSVEENPCEIQSGHMKLNFPSYLIHPSNSLELTPEEFQKADKSKAVGPTTAFVPSKIVEMLYNSTHEDCADEDFDPEDDTTD